jgi:hypothetical protein
MVDLPDAPRTRSEQFGFLRAAHDGPHVWHRECLSLTRQAPGIPGGIPSARAAMLMVPTSDRIHHVHGLRRGMVLFFDDPNDDNPFGHVVTVAGWHTTQPTDSLDDVLTWSADVPHDAGEVGLVRASFFTSQWGVPMVYGSTSLNGFDLPGYGRAATTPVRQAPSLQDTLDAAITAVRHGIRAQRQKGHQRKVRALTRDLRELQDTRRLQVNH